MKNGFKGLWPAMFTPVDTNGDPAFDQIEKLTDLLISQEMDGLYILGSTGQGVLFSHEQRKQVTEVVTKVAAGRVPIIAQVGALTTEQSIQLTVHAEKCGVDGISSVGPIYYAASPDTAIQHYRSIAQATSLPFIPYQLGDNSIPGDTISFVKRLLEIPNVAGMKLTTNQLLEISLIHNYAGDRLSLFSGSDELFCHASLCGTVGAIGSTYNIWGTQCKQVMTEFANGNYQLSKEFMLAYQDVIQTIMPNIWTFMRAAMRLRHNIETGATKPPLANTQAPWDDAEVMQIVERIEAFTSELVQK